MSQAIGFIAQSNGGGGVIGIVFVLVWLALMAGVLAGTWKAFTKAGEPGWAALVPVYNIWVMLRIGGNDEVLYLILILFVPLANLYGLWVMFDGVAEAFGQGTGFALGLFFLGFIFWPLLGFGDYQYRGAAA